MKILLLKKKYPNKPNSGDYSFFAIYLKELFFVAAVILGEMKYPILNEASMKFFLTINLRNKLKQNHRVFCKFEVVVLISRKRVNIFLQHSPFSTPFSALSLNAPKLQAAGL